MTNKEKNMVIKMFITIIVFMTLIIFLIVDMRKDLWRTPEGYKTQWEVVTIEDGETVYSIAANTLDRHAMRGKITLIQEVNEINRLNEIGTGNLINEGATLIVPYIVEDPL